MTAPLTLHYAPDNASLCVRIALSELGMAFQTTLVDRGRMAQKDPAYLALNPNGLIPTLETPEGPIFETAAILLWLADQKPGSMFPAPDAPDRGTALSRLFWMSNTLHATMRMLFYPSLFAPKAEEILRKQCRNDLARFFSQLEASGTDTWLDEDAPSILACYFAPLIRWPALYGGAVSLISKEAYPRISAFAKRFEVRPALLSAAHAEGLGPTPISNPQPANPPEGTTI